LTPRQDWASVQVMVHIIQLTAALRQTLWRQGFIHPEALQHTRDERGDHVFRVVIPQGDCAYETPTAPTERGVGR
jgi:hypothetical protein